MLWGYEKWKKTGVLRRLGRVRTKNLLSQTSENFFSLYSLPMMIQISRKVLIWLKNVFSIKKLPPSKVESFLISNI